ncbi:MAG: aminotransferase class III-fold pyridoxal phosphate-dependent enzyme [Sediminibacterium sp.]|nr:aminotransferase class III-fold pyridoxal phosphate-dependent enzyme [Sediminibacterium sp.]
MTQNHFLSEKIVTQNLRNRYSLDGMLSLIAGEFGQNFILTDNQSNRFIIKIISHLEKSELAGQLAMMAHLETSDLKNCFPKIITSKNNSLFINIKNNNTIFYMFVLSYIDGVFWEDTKNLSEEHFKKLGTFLGKMDKDLQSFSHFGLHRNLFWDLNKTLLAQDKLYSITDIEVKRLVDYFLLQFEYVVQPHIQHLRQAYIHNDAHEGNILLNRNEIVGLIDFGDCVYSSLINNLAISCTYTTMELDHPETMMYQLVQAYHQEYCLTELELDLLYYLIAARLCISISQSFYRKSLESSNNHHHYLSHNKAIKMLTYWIQLNPLKFQHELRRHCGFSKLIEPFNQNKNIEQRYEHIPKNLSISYQEKLHINQGALQYLYDNQGNTYIDCVNNPAHIGHCHPKVVRAVNKQNATLNTNTRYFHDHLIKYAQKLKDTLPKKLSKCFFVNSGSEANDLAIRISRTYTKQKDVIVLDYAYHGTTITDIEMSPYKFKGKGGFPQPDWVHIAESPDLYRGRFKNNDPEAGKKYAQSILNILEKMDLENKKPAAFICESLLGVGGQIPLPVGYLKEIYQYVRQAGGVCIADEVQVGFGRVGNYFWGFELQEVEPDIVVLGKPMGNTHPLAAVVVTDELAHSFYNGMEYFNTFGGNPVSMIAGLKVLEVLEEEQLQQHALVIGSFLLTELKPFVEKYPIIGDVRGHGFFIGIEFVKDKICLEPAASELSDCIQKMKSKGILVSADGPFNNVLKFKPPMVFSKQNAIDFKRALAESLDELL